jgi:hypothetical protein
MTRFVLQNDINLRGIRLKAGKVVTDKDYVIADLTAAGALLQPAGNAGALTRAGVLQQQSRSGFDPTFEVASRVDAVGPFLPSGSAAQALATRTVTTATDTVDGTGVPDNEIIYNYSTGVGQETAPVPTKGREFTVTNESATQAVTVLPHGTEHFHSPAGSTTSFSVPAGNSATFRSDGTDWFVV